MAVRKCPSDPAFSVYSGGFMGWLGSSFNLNDTVDPASIHSAPTEGVRLRRHQSFDAVQSLPGRLRGVPGSPAAPSGASCAGAPLAASSHYGGDQGLNETYDVFPQRQGGYALNETYNVNETSASLDNSLDEALTLVQEFEQEVQNILQGFGLNQTFTVPPRTPEPQGHVAYEVHSPGVHSELIPHRPGQATRGTASLPGTEFAACPPRAPEPQGHVAYEVHSPGVHSELIPHRPGQANRTTASLPGTEFVCPPSTPIPPGFVRPPRPAPQPSPGSSWSSGYGMSQPSSGSSGSSECPAPGFHPHLAPPYPPPEGRPGGKGARFFVPAGTPQSPEPCPPPPSEPCRPPGPKPPGGGIPPGSGVPPSPWQPCPPGGGGFPPATPPPGPSRHTEPPPRSSSRPTRPCPAVGGGLTGPGPLPLCPLPPRAPPGQQENCTELMRGFIEMVDFGFETLNERAQRAQQIRDIVTQMQGSQASCLQHLQEFRTLGISSIEGYLRQVISCWTSLSQAYLETLRRAQSIGCCPAGSAGGSQDPCRPPGKVVDQRRGQGSERYYHLIRRAATLARSIEREMYCDTTLLSQLINIYDNVEGGLNTAQSFLPNFYQYITWAMERTEAIRCLFTSSREEFSQFMIECQQTPSDRPVTGRPGPCAAPPGLDPCPGPSGLSLPGGPGPSRPRTPGGPGPSRQDPCPGPSGLSLPGGPGPSRPSLPGGPGPSRPCTPGGPGPSRQPSRPGGVVDCAVVGAQSTPPNQDERVHLWMQDTSPSARSWPPGSPKKKGGVVVSPHYETPRTPTKKEPKILEWMDRGSPSQASPQDPRSVEYLYDTFNEIEGTALHQVQNTSDESQALNDTLNAVGKDNGNNESQREI